MERDFRKESGPMYFDYWHPQDKIAWMNEVLDEIDRLKKENEELADQNKMFIDELMSMRGAKRDEEIEQVKKERDEYRNRLNFSFEEKETILDMLKDVVNQACAIRDVNDGEYYLNTLAISSYEDAIKWLVEKGHAEWIDKGYRARWKE